MNLKYCYKREIHKTFSPPSTFQALLEDIRTVFEAKLPIKFSIQYKDNDQDLITISSDSEYKSMLKFDAPSNPTSIRLFIVPTDQIPEEKEISFEVIDTSQSDVKDAGISEISLSSGRSESSSSREDSPTPKGKQGSNSFQNFDTLNNSEMKEQKVHVSSVEPCMNQTFSQLYEAEALILQSLQAEPIEKNGCEVKEEEEAVEDQNKDSNESMVSQPDSLCLRDEAQEDARSLENEIFSSEIDRVTEELVAKNTMKMLEKLRTPSKYEDSLLNQFLYPHNEFQDIQDTQQRNSCNDDDNNNLSFDLKDQYHTPTNNNNIRRMYQHIEEPNNNISDNAHRYSNFFNSKRRLWTDDTQDPNQDYPSDLFPKIEKHTENSNSPKQRGWSRFPTLRKIVNCDNYQKIKSPTYYQPSTTLYSRHSPSYNPMRNTAACGPYYKHDRITLENHGYEVTTGLSSRLFSIGDNEGQRVVYKTVFIKNTGTKPWTRCFVKSVGLIAGKTVELCNIEAGQTAVVTLELTGYFTSRTYTSRWKLVHENHYGMVEVIGGPFDVEFTINSNIITGDKVKMNTCEQSFEDDLRGDDYGRQEYVEDGYQYEDFVSEGEKRIAEEQELEADQTFARYFHHEEEGEDYEPVEPMILFSQQDLRPVRNFVSNGNDSIDEYYLN